MKFLLIIAVLIFNSSCVDSLHDHTVAYTLNDIGERDLTPSILSKDFPDLQIVFKFEESLLQVKNKNELLAMIGEKNLLFNPEIISTKIKDIDDDGYKDFYCLIESLSGMRSFHTLIYLGNGKIYFGRSFRTEPIEE